MQLQATGELAVLLLFPSDVHQMHKYRGGGEYIINLLIQGEYPILLFRNRDTRSLIHTHAVIYDRFFPVENPKVLF